MSLNRFSSRILVLGLCFLLVNCVPNTNYQADYNVTQIDRKTDLVERQKADPNTVTSEIRPNRDPLNLNDSINTNDLSSADYYALVIGVNEYFYLPGLKTAVNDARRLTRVLSNDYGFKTQLLTNPSRADLISALSDYRAKLTGNDRFLIYYAGHGWLDEEAQEGYWLPTDAERSNPANWVSNSTITSYLKSIEARHLLVIADSCYSGTLTRGLNLQQRTPNYFQKMAARKSRTVLTSGGLEPVSDVGGVGNHSIFASAMFNALEQNRNIMDGNDLFAAVKSPVQFNSDQVPQYSIIHKAGHDGGEFLFIRQ